MVITATIGMDPRQDLIIVEERDARGDDASPNRSQIRLKRRLGRRLSDEPHAGRLATGLRTDGFGVGVGFGFGIGVS